MTGCDTFLITAVTEMSRVAAASICAKIKPLRVNPAAIEAPSRRRLERCSWLMTVWS